MMNAPPFSFNGMDRLPVPLPFNPEYLWRYNPLGPYHSGPPVSPSAVASAAMAMSRINVGASPPNPFIGQLPLAYDIKYRIPISLARSPRLWDREDVLYFLEWCEREFDLPSLDMDRFQMNGLALCLLTKSDVESRALCSGDVIYNALQSLISSLESPLTPHIPYMRLGPLSNGGWPIAGLHYPASHQNGTTSATLSLATSLDAQAGSPQEHAGENANNDLSSSSSTVSTGNHSVDSEYDRIEESRQGSLSPSHSVSQQQHNSHQSNSSSSTTSSNGQSSSSSSNNINNHSSSQQNNFSNWWCVETGRNNKNCRLLWYFLLQLLNDPAQRHSRIIVWRNFSTGIFKIVDSEGLATLWGIQKNSSTMDYDKLSRALRYYYRVNILRKVWGHSHCYQFVRNPAESIRSNNISMIRHQPTFPVSRTVNSGSSNFVDNHYDALSRVRQQRNTDIWRPVSFGG